MGILNGFKRVLSRLKQTIIYSRNIYKIEHRKDKNKQLHIVFLVQLMSLWGKTELVFEEALKQKDVKVTLIAIPDRRDMINEVESYENETYKALEKYGTDVVNAVKAKGQWFDLKKINPDYVFYPRPYDVYLPEEYRSSVVSNYAKVCYIPYGFLLTATCLPTCLNYAFFRNCYFYFAENSYYVEYNRKRFWLTHFLNLRKSVTLGYPVFAKLLDSKNKISASWNEIDEEGKFKVIWTPRWTTDLNAGGSNFFVYKDSLIQLADEYKDMAIVYRPHPLTFQNFLKTGELTEAELLEFRDYFDRSDNLYIEEKADYYDTFWGSDVLLTDVSSVDIEYFITGKPVVYCYREAIQFSEFAEKLYSVAYWAKDWQEAKNHILNLKNGMDPLKNERKKMVEELLGTDYKSVAEKIVNEIKKDNKNEK